MHYGRDVKYGDPGEAAYRKAPRNQSEWKVNSDGYVVRSTNRGKQLQHRVVMEGILGRALLPLETVHHKNGVRSDNDPSNLELWSKAQPAGQRVEDKITWAIEFLSQYGYGVTIPPP